MTKNEIIKNAVQTLVQIESNERGDKAAARKNCVKVADRLLIHKQSKPR